MSPRRFHVYALDALFFRDSRPFDAADEGMADVVSLFPPHPEALDGAFRAAVARAQGWNGRGRWTAVDPELGRCLGRDRNDPGELVCGEPVLLRYAMPRAGAKRLYPAPLHLGLVERGHRKLPGLLRPGETRHTDVGPARLLAPPPGEDRAEVPEGRWLDDRTFADVLHGRAPQKENALQPLTRLVARERRVGIARAAATRTARQGQLYVATLVRPRELGVALGLEVEGLLTDWSPSRLGLVGGFQKLAECVEGDWEDADRPTLPGPDDAGIYRYIVVLTSPLRLRDGDPDWRPPRGELRTNDGRTLETVVAAAVGRPLMIGGWDSLRGRQPGPGEPLPLTPCLPPGSVFFIESLTPPPDEPLRLGDRAAFGYGRCRLGCWPQDWSEGNA